MEVAASSMDYHHAYGGQQHDYENDNSFHILNNADDAAAGRQHHFPLKRCTSQSMTFSRSPSQQFMGNYGPQEPFSYSLPQSASSATVDACLSEKKSANSRSLSKRPRRTATLHLQDPELEATSGKSAEEIEKLQFRVALSRKIKQRMAEKDDPTRPVLAVDEKKKPRSFTGKYGSKKVGSANSASKKNVYSPESTVDASVGGGVGFSANDMMFTPQLDYDASSYEWGLAGSSDMIFQNDYVGAANPYNLYSPPTSNTASPTAPMPETAAQGGAVGAIINPNKAESQTSLAQLFQPHTIPSEFSQLNLQIPYHVSGDLANIGDIDMNATSYMCPVVQVWDLLPTEPQNTMATMEPSYGTINPSVAFSTHNQYQFQSVLPMAGPPSRIFHGVSNKTTMPMAISPPSPTSDPSLSHTQSAEQAWASHHQPSLLKYGCPSPRMTLGNWALLDAPFSRSTRDLFAAASGVNSSASLTSMIPEGRGNSMTEFLLNDGKEEQAGMLGDGGGEESSSRMTSAETLVDVNLNCDMLLKTESVSRLFDFM